MRNPAKVTNSVASALFALVATVSVGQEALSADLSQAISSNDHLRLFARAAVKTGLDGMLKGPGRFILFIPTDRALAAEGSAFLLDRVLLTESNAGRLADLVRHHVVRTGNQGPQLPGDVELNTLADVPLAVTHVGHGLMVDGHAAVTGRIVADNGVIYIVDRLLWPRAAGWTSGTRKLSRVGPYREPDGR